MKKYLFLAAVLTLLFYCNYPAHAQSVPPAADTTLQNSRKKIDRIDKQLIELIGEREKIVKEIGIYKAKNNIAPLQAARFQEVLNQAIAAGEKEGLSAEFVTELLNAIHKESLRIEEDIKKNQ
ncbi:chorismate mutase [Mucilaginibacter sp. McL0603]|uniref:chorismate mutase n=1 Tax=Mucilaginibacter sp. McL0603 TaxID=3415670 RepID=UPI003CEC6E71